MAAPAFPATIRQPGVYGLTDDSRANTASGAPKPVYLMAEYSALGTGYAADTAYLVGSASEVADIAGNGSALHRMAVAYFAGRPSGVPVYAVPVAASSGGAAATGKITVTLSSGSTADIDCVHVVRIAGQDFAVNVTAGMSVTNIADLFDALTASTSYPVTAANVAGVITLTARHKGELGNQIKIEFDPDGAPDGSNVVFTLTNAMGHLAAGSGVPDYSAALSAIAEAEWDLLVMYGVDTDPYTDCHAILNDTNGRWSYNRRQDGHVVNPIAGTLATIVAWAGSETATYPWLTMHGLEGVAAGTNALWGTPPWEMAGAIAAAMMTWRIGNTSRACEDRAIIESTDWHMDPPPDASRWAFDDRDAILAAGAATLYYDAVGAPRLQVTRTTQVTTPDGAPTNAYEMWRTRVILSDFGATQRARIKSEFQTGGAKPSTTRILRAIKASLCAIYRQFCDDERMDPDSFATYAASVNVARNGTDANRVDILDEPQVSGTASKITIRNMFRLI
jgi:phage tail sheath gpL-like